jgi:hypothetical protein
MSVVDDVKNYMDITWQDDATDKKVAGIVARGQAYLDRLTGESNNYESEGSARALLFDYVRYAFAEVLEDFEKNFCGELAQLRQDAVLARKIAAQKAGDVDAGQG